MSASAVEVMEDLASAGSETIPQSVDNLITTFENGEKPWFLKVTEIYGTAKQAAHAIPLGEMLFDKSISAVSSVTKTIETNTKLHVAFDVEMSHDLINKIDSLILEHMVVADDGMDHLRSRLAVSLRHLLSAIVLHTNWATESAKTQTGRTYGNLRTRFEAALEMLRAIVETVKDAVPLTVNKVKQLGQTAEARSVEFITFTTETAVHLSTVGKDKLLSVSQSTGVLPLAMWALQTAQPYVRFAIKQTQPYATQAIEMSQPYVDKAKPYVDPLITKAKELNGKVLDSKMVGSLVAQAETFALESAEHLYHETQEYCLDTPIAVQQ
jgi:hypothetical protein